MVSYCRFFDSDACVYTCDVGIICYGCRLFSDAKIDFVAKKSSEMLEHLQDHIEAGHTITEHAIDRLTSEARHEWVNVEDKLPPEGLEVLASIFNYEDGDHFNYVLSIKKDPDDSKHLSWIDRNGDQFPVCYEITQWKYMS